MARIKIEGVAGFDGEYPFEPGDFTYDDWNLIKQASGVRAGELIEALGANDITVVPALAVIAVRAAGKVVTLDYFRNQKAGSITLDLGGDEDDEQMEGGVAVPPQSGPVAPESGSEPTPSSGETSDTTVEESQAMPLRAIGL